MYNQYHMKEIAPNAIKLLDVLKLASGYENTDKIQKLDSVLKVISESKEQYVSRYEIERNCKITLLEKDFIIVINKLVDDKAIITVKNKDSKIVGYHIEQLGNDILEKGGYKFWYDNDRRNQKRDFYDYWYKKIMYYIWWLPILISGVAWYTTYSDNENKSKLDSNYTKNNQAQSMRIDSLKNEVYLLKTFLSQKDSNVKIQ